ncbi:hypothetical protein GRI39_11685 [Altererythrobacter indicus]|uniref:Uncharacterized protein n=1 Tax=Altericroceibacterium indicum TaxID=374177 RepID=A0A845ADS1_9SPHN|nr:hypothetical protein [Altericroceibacterium indicum]MXP26696.1 hypothetical protein [Altericroceibacterium indicum]
MAKVVIGASAKPLPIAIFSVENQTAWVSCIISEAKRQGFSKANAPQTVLQRAVFFATGFKAITVPDNFPRGNLRCVIQVQPWIGIVVHNPIMLIGMLLGKTVSHGPYLMQLSVMASKNLKGRIADSQVGTELIHYQPPFIRP